MFIVTCSHCGNQTQQDEALVPVSGVVTKCPSCGKAMIVMPPKAGDSSQPKTAPTNPPVRATQTLVPGGGARTAPPTTKPPASPATKPPPIPTAKKLAGPALAAFDAEENEFGAGVDLPAPKGPRPAAGAAAAEIVDLPAPKMTNMPRAASQAELGMPDLPVPVGPSPTRGAKPDLDDLLAPVGPSSRNADLPAPVGPFSRTSDLLAPVGPTSRNADLLAPVGPTPRSADLLQPVGPTSRNADLPAPLGPSRAGEAVSPVGATMRPTDFGPAVIPNPRATDMLQPVGPTSRNMDLPRPVGPTPRSLDLPTPVGPESRNIGLPTPVGPESRGIGLPTPVGPEPRPGLPTPVGPESRALGLPTPVGPQPTKNLDIAPKGFFDDIPQPKTGVRNQPAPTTPLPLDLEDLDVVPATGPPPRPEAPAFPPTPTKPFTIEGLDLIEPGAPPPPPPESSDNAGGMNYGEVPVPPSDDLQVVSFGKPATQVKPAPAGIVDTGLGGGVVAEPDPDSLDVAGPIRREKGTIAADPEPVSRVGDGLGEAVRPVDKRDAKGAAKPLGKRAKAIASVLGVLAVLGAGGFYVYTQMSLQVFGFKTKPFKEREEEIRNGLVDVRKFMASDERGHWDKAAAAARKLVALDRKNADALGLLAQANLAAAVDEGQDYKRHVDSAEETLSDGIKVGAKGVELDKAQALRDALEGKASEGKRSLAAVAQKNRGDADVFLYSGWVANEGHDYAAAKTAFETVLQLAPNRLAAQYGLGRALLAVGDPAGARKQFEKVMAKYPDRKHFGAWLGITELIPADRAHTREKELGILVERAPERETAHPRDVSRAWTLYGDEALAQNLFDRAADRYRKAAEIDPHNLDAMVGFAFTALEQGKRDEARGRLQSVQALDPNHVRALVGLARLAILDGRVADAATFINAAVKVAPNNPLVQLWLGHVVARDPNLGGEEAAETAYRKAMQLAPDDYQAYVALARMLSGMKGRESDAMAVLAPVERSAMEDSVLSNTLGETYLSAREAAKAEVWFRQALTLNDKNVQARSNLGASLELAGKVPDALAEYERAYAIDPKGEEITLRLANAYAKLERWDDADKLYQAMVTNTEKAPSTTARAAAGRYWAHRDDVAAASEQGLKILEIDPKMPAGLFLRGFGEMSEGKFNDALRDINEAITLDPQAQYWDGLGRTFEKQNALSEALAAFEKSSRIEDKYVAPRMGRARIRMVRAEYKAALAELDDIVKIDPDNAEAWARIGECDFQERELGASTKALTQSLKLDPTRAEAYFMRGRTLQDDPNGSRSGAISDLNKAIELGKKINPLPEWYAEAHGLLGFLYKATGSHNLMCLHFQEYMSLTQASEGMREEAKRALMSCDR